MCKLVVTMHSDCGNEFVERHQVFVDFEFLKLVYFFHEDVVIKLVWRSREVEAQINSILDILERFECDFPMSLISSLI
jgi:hypothetical protein